MSEKREIDIGSAPAELDRRFPDWITFPIFRNVYEAGDGLFCHDGAPATGTYYFPTLNRYMSFSGGRWLAIWQAEIRNVIGRVP